jgi:hypothetical protein
MPGTPKSDRSANSHDFRWHAKSYRAILPSLNNSALKPSFLLSNDRKRGPSFRIERCPRRGRGISDKDRWRSPQISTDMLSPCAARRQANWNMCKGSGSQFTVSWVGKPGNEVLRLLLLLLLQLQSFVQRHGRHEIYRRAPISSAPPETSPCGGPPRPAYPASDAPSPVQAASTPATD